MQRKQEIMATKTLKTHKNKAIFRWFLFSLCLCVSVVNLSCSSKPTDLRTLVPAETLVYLETNDLAAALQPIVDAKPFMEVAKSKPDFSALKGVQLAVAVTGFETSEEKLTDEQSVGRVQPRFVAVAETHAWSFQANAFAEQKLGGFVREIYDSEPKLEKSDKNGGKYFKWTATDGRKAFALVDGSVIYFGNDETAIDKCLAVKRGETDSINTTGKVPTPSTETLASGYVSTDGIAQIANIIGLKYASETSEDSGVQSAIAGILPELLRKSITDITWTATKTDEGIEDKYQISMPAEIANVFNETMVANDGIDSRLIAELPENVSTVTLYNLKSPQVAWRSLLLVTQKQADSTIAAGILISFAGGLFEPYGIREPELFLSSVEKKPQGHNILVAKLDAEGERIVTIMNRALDEGPMVKSLMPGLKLHASSATGAILSTQDENLQVIFDRESVRIGSKESLDSCSNYGATDLKSEQFRRLSLTQAPVATIGRDTATSLSLIEMLTHVDYGDTQVVSTYFSETRFTKSGMERKTVSDFGLIGSIIAQLGAE